MPVSQVGETTQNETYDGGGTDRSMPWYQLKYKPSIVPAYCLFTGLSSSAVVFTMEQQNWIIAFTLIILECAFVFFWDYFESEESKKFYSQSIKYFKVYDDINYFLLFGANESQKIKSQSESQVPAKSKNKEVQAQQIPQADTKTTFCEFRMLLPFLVALLLNSIAITWVCLFVRLCETECALGDMWCYSILLVPRIMNLGISAYFLMSYKSVYLEKHWLERDNAD